MSSTQFAAQLGINKSGVGRLEESERSGSIKLDTLRRAGEAMNCTLVYALVPNADYDQIVDRQARAVTAEAVAQTLQTMALEGQAPDADAVTRMHAQAAADAISRGQVWDR